MDLADTAPQVRRRQLEVYRAMSPQRRVEQALAITGLLAEILSALDAAGIPHMVAGSLASTHHGEPRSTNDLDIVIDPSATGLARSVAGLDPDRFAKLEWPKAGDSDRQRRDVVTMLAVQGDTVDTAGSRAVGRRQSPRRVLTSETGRFGFR